jgi:hypothetical protein
MRKGLLFFKGIFVKKVKNIRLPCKKWGVILKNPKNLKKVNSCFFLF